MLYGEKLTRWSRRELTGHVGSLPNGAYDGTARSRERGAENFSSKQRRCRLGATAAGENECGRGDGDGQQRGRFGNDHALDGEADRGRAARDCADPDRRICQRLAIAERGPPYPLCRVVVYEL